MSGRQFFLSILSGLSVCFILSGVAKGDIGPVAYWKMDEGGGTVIYDKSSNGNDGAVNGAIWGGECGGFAMDFDGADDYVSVPGSTSLDVTTELTIMAWVKPHSFTNNAYEGIVWKRDGTDSAQRTAYALTEAYSDGRPRFCVSTDVANGQGFHAGTAMTINQWQHVAVTYKSGDARFYRNGNPDGATTAITGTIKTNTEPVCIGKGPSYYFDGELDEMRIYNRILSEQEIKEYSESAACWKMNEGSGTVVHDQTPHVNDGVNNGASWITDAERGAVLEFDGTDDYVSIPDSPSFDATDEITIMVWVKPHSLSGSTYEGIVYKEDPSDLAESTLYGLCANLNPHFFVSTDDADAQGFSANTAMITNQWQHIAVTYKSGDARFYRNGNPDGAVADITGTIKTNAKPVVIGKRGSWHFDGDLGEVVIYKRVLTEQEIRDYARCAAHWKMDEGAGNVIIDHSSNANTGTITGASWITDTDRGSVLEFDGVDDYISVPDSSSLDITAELTIMAWVKPHSFINNAYEGIVWKRDPLDSGQRTAYALTGAYSDARPRFCVSTDVANGQGCYAGTAMTVNQWQHVAVTYKSGEVRFYRNGSSDGVTTSITGTIKTSNDQVCIGKGPSYYFDGDLDDVRIYNRVLTAEEMTLYYRDYLATICVVPAITDNKILPDSFISEGYVSNEISISACPGEYYPASFVVQAHKDVDSMEVAVTNLTGGGNTILSSNINVRTVKCWYQAGTTINKGNKVLTPELLLKDDALVSVENGNNYLYVSGLGYVIISDPNGIPGIPDVPTIAEFPVQDSANLQAVDISSGMNKQFWVTIHVPETASPGDYEGTITLSTPVATIGTIKLKLEVLPITLSPSEVMYSVYYSSGLRTVSSEGTISRRNKNETQFAAELANLYAHGVVNPNFYPQTYLTQALTMRNAAGMGNQPFYYLMNFSSYGSDLDALKAWVSAAINLVTPYGVTQLYIYGPDETLLDTALYRSQMNAVHEVGGKVFDAQPQVYAAAVPDILDLAVVSGGPSSTLAASYHGYGNEIMSYANPQAGEEKPETYRRNYGLLLWQHDYDGAMNFAYQWGFGNIWDDFDDASSYRDHNFTYPTMDGVIDTIQWEGFRAGVDDMRYLATLLDVIELAKAQNIDTSAAENWLVSLKSSSLANLDDIRSTMVFFILELQ